MEVITLYSLEWDGFGRRKSVEKLLIWMFLRQDLRKWIQISLMIAIRKVSERRRCRPKSKQKCHSQQVAALFMHAAYSRMFCQVYKISTLDQQKRATIFQNAFTDSSKCFLDNSELLYFFSHFFACTPHVCIKN